MKEASEAMAKPLLSHGQVLAVAFGIGVIALVVVLLPLLLGLSNRRDSAAVKPPASESRRNFFEIPYITWFLVHYGIAALAILAIVLLGIDDVIDKGTVSALLGSLFGYVLGNASRGGSSPKGSGSETGKLPVDPKDKPPVDAKPGPGPTAPAGTSTEAIPPVTPPVAPIAPAQTSTAVASDPAVS